MFLTCKNATSFLTMTAHHRLILPQRDDQHLQQVISYLNISRRIPLAIIQNLIASKSLYADQNANAVFLLLGKEKRILIKFHVMSVLFFSLSSGKYIFIPCRTKSKKGRLPLRS